MTNGFLNQFAMVLPHCVHGFLGLEPWYKYLPSSDFGTGGNECDIKHFQVLGSSSDIPAVLVAVVDDLLKIAGLVAFAFIIVAAVKFVTSEGNPENAANARSTLINALVGMAIAITATVFVSFIGNQIGK